MRLIRLKPVFFILIPVSLGFSLLSSPRASAQMSIARIQITNVDAKNFPDVTMQAIIRDGNGNPVPISDQQNNLQLIEKVSGRELVVSSDMAEITSGIEVIFILDLGVDIARYGTQWSSQMQEIVRSYVVGMSEEDTTGIWTITSAGVNYLQPLTSDQAKLTEALSNLPTAVSWTDGLAGVTDALSELSKSFRRDSFVQTIVLLTSGLYNVQEGDSDIRSLAAKARDANVTIHTILVRNAEYSSAPPLIGLATGSAPGGLYVHYTSDTDAKPILTWLSNQRKQTRLSFRSASGDGAERTLELNIRNGSLSDTITYQVDVQAPVVEIIRPSNNSEYERKAESYDQGQSKTTMDSVDPTTVEVAASVTWPDSYPRATARAQFLLDDLPIQTVDNPLGTITFSWNLTQYWTADIKGAPHKLKIKIWDEFGLESASEPVTAKVTVTIPPKPTEVVIIVSGGPPTLKPDICKDLKSLKLVRCQITNQTIPQIKYYVSQPSNWISIGSLLVALVAVILTIRFRGQIVQAGSAAIDVVRDTVTRLTRPAGMAEVGAYLEVLRGDEELKGKPIPLYIRTVTPVGRNPQEAELVFDLANERSVVSRRHCEFREENGEFKVRDLGSTHGTYVNGIRLPEGGDGQILSDGDKIELGPAERGGVLLQFKLASSGGGVSDYEDLYKTRPAYSDDSFSQSKDSYDYPEDTIKSDRRKLVG